MTPLSMLPCVDPVSETPQQISAVSNEAGREIVGEDDPARGEWLEVGGRIVRAQRRFVDPWLVSEGR